MGTGSYLSSRAVASQVLSAYKGLTSVFGMGTGGTSLPSPPETLKGTFSHPQNLILLISSRLRLSGYRIAFLNFLRLSLLDQALDLLVPASYTHRCASTASLSTLSSSRGLTSLCCGNLLLEGGFTLRCLQRLSRPYFASLLCRWHDNSCTSGTSIPVLSY